MRALVRWAARRHISTVFIRAALLVLVALAPVPLRAQAPRIVTELDTALVSVGDRMAFTVRVEHDPASIVVWPDSLDLGSIEVLGAEFLPTDDEGGRTNTGARFTLAAFELGDIEIPSFEIRVEAPDGSSTTLSTDTCVITVQSVGLDEGGDIRAIRGPLGIPVECDLRPALDPSAGAAGWARVLAVGQAQACRGQPAPVGGHSTLSARGRLRSARPPGGVPTSWSAERSRSTTSSLLRSSEPTSKAASACTPWR